MNSFITTFTLVSNVAFILLLLAIVFDKKVRHFIYRIVLKYPLELIFIITLSAFVFSLAYSNIAGFPPCELCWIQRIFMYPQVLLSFMAIVKKDKGIISYLLPLSVLGTIVAFYQTIVNWGYGGDILECTSQGGECAKVFVSEYGYITIPFMAFTSFVYLLTITIVYFFAVHNREKHA